MPKPLLSTSELRLDRRKNVFGLARVDAFGQPAVTKSVENVDYHSDSEPDEEPAPGNDWQAEHERAAEKHPHRWKPGNPWYPEGTMSSGLGSSQHNYPDTHQDECK